MGQQIAQMTATGVEQATASSYAQTEVFFIQHCDYLMPRVHQMRTDLAQYYHSTKPSSRLSYVTTADEKVNFEINGTDLLMRDLNIFCSTTANHRAILEQLKQMAMQNNTTGASVYDLGRIVQSDSIAQLNTVLKDSEAKQQQSKQQEMEAQQKMQEDKLKADAEEAKFKREYEEVQKEKDRQTEILVAEIRAAGYGSMADVNANEVSDYQDAMKDIRQTEQYQTQNHLQRDKDATRTMLDRDKNAIEREKLNVQREIADKQLQVAKVNKNKYDKGGEVKNKK
jgi:hypothetical protein